MLVRSVLGKHFAARGALEGLEARLALDGEGRGVLLESIHGHLQKNTRWTTDRLQLTLRLAAFCFGGIALTLLLRSAGLLVSLLLLRFVRSYLFPLPMVVDCQELWRLWEKVESLQWRSLAVGCPIDREVWPPKKRRSPDFRR